MLLALDRQATPSRQRLTLVATILASAMTFVDATVVNVALPAIGEDLDAGLAGQQWVFLAYSLVLAALFIPAGALGDRYGRRRLFLLGTAGFALASLLAGAAPDTATLIAARVVQGVAGAVVTTNGLALLRATFGRESGRAVGAWTAWTGVTSVAGPLAGGVLVEASSWRFIFLVNLPLAAVALLLGWAGRCGEVAADAPPDAAAAAVQWPPACRESQATPAESLNVVAAATLALTFGALTYALVEAPGRGLAAVWWAAALAVAGAAAFAWNERRSAHPLVPRSLLRVRNFAAANAATLVVYAALGAGLFFLPLYLQSAAVGFSAAEASFVFAPVSLVMLVLSGPFARRADRDGPRLLLAAGPVVMAAGMLVWLLLDAQRSWSVLVPGLLILAVGLSMVVAPITSLALSAAPESLAGVAAGVNTTVSRIGGLLAIAAVGALAAAVFAASTDADVDTPFTERAASAEVRGATEDAFRATTVVCAALLLAGGVVAAVGVSDADARRRAGG